MTLGFEAPGGSIFLAHLFHAVRCKAFSSVKDQPHSACSDASGKQAAVEAVQLQALPGVDSSVPRRGLHRIHFHFLLTLLPGLRQLLVLPLGQLDPAQHLVMGRQVILFPHFLKSNSSL